MSEPTRQKISVGIADDHQLFVRSLSMLVDSFDGFVTTVDALNGDQLLAKLEKTAQLPELLLIDVNMPSRDGIATATGITKKYPLIKMVALSMNRTPPNFGEVARS